MEDPGPLVWPLLEFLEVVVHQILWLREVYPPWFFDQCEHLGAPVQRARHRPLADYVRRHVRQLQPAISSSSLQRIEVIVREARPRRRRLGRRLETHAVDLSRLLPGALPASLARSPLADPVDPPIAPAALADPPPTPAMAEALRGFLLRQLATLATLPGLRRRPDGSWRKLTWELRARVLEGEGGGDDVEDAGWIDVRGEEEVVEARGEREEEGGGVEGEGEEERRGAVEESDGRGKEEGEDGREAMKAESAGNEEKSAFAPGGTPPTSLSDAEGELPDSPRHREPSALPHPSSPPLRKPALASPSVASPLWPAIPEAPEAPFDGRPGSLPTEGATWVASQEESANGEGPQGVDPPLPATQPLPDCGEQSGGADGEEGATGVGAVGERPALGASRPRSSPTLSVSSSAPNGHRSPAASPGRVLSRSPKSPRSPHSPSSLASPRSPRSPAFPPLAPPIGLPAFRSSPSRHDRRARESPASRRLLSGPLLPSSPVLLTQARAPDSPAFLAQPSPSSSSPPGASPERRRARAEGDSGGEGGRGGRARLEPFRDPDSPVLAQRPPEEEENSRSGAAEAAEGFRTNAPDRDSRPDSDADPRSDAPLPSGDDALAVDLFRGSTQRALEARAQGGLGRGSRRESVGPMARTKREEMLGTTARIKRKRESSPARLLHSSQTSLAGSPNRPSSPSRATSPPFSLPSSLESLPSPVSSSLPSQVDLAADNAPPSRAAPDLDAASPPQAALDPGAAAPSQTPSASSSSASWPSSSSSSSDDDDTFPAKTLVPIRSAAVPPYWRLQLYVLREPDADE